ncbi:MAG: hypothetical protein ACR2OI_02030 [Acidimicrobiia bacterium]
MTSVLHASGQQPSLELEAGKVVGLVGAPGFGLTRLGLGLLRDQPGWVACVDVRGWLSPAALWEVGVSPERAVIVRCPDARRWPQVTAALVEGMRAVYAEVPSGVAAPMLRRLGALARARATPVMLRPLGGDIPAGLAHLRLEAQSVAWKGAGRGRGRLQERNFTLAVSGKGAGGIQQIIEVEDDGTNAVRVVPRLGVAMPERAVG